MIARIAIIAAALSSVAAAQPRDVVALSVAMAHLERLGVDTADLLAVAHVETGGTLRRGLVSRAGACGVMQVMPRWSPLTCEEMSEPLGGVSAVYVRRGHMTSGRLVMDDYLVPAEYIDGLSKKSFRWVEVKKYKVPPGKVWLDATDPRNGGWAPYLHRGWGR